MKTNKLLNIFAFGTLITLLSSCGGNVVSSTTNNDNTTSNSATSEATSSEISTYPDVDSKSFELNYNNVSIIKNSAEGLLLISKTAEFNPEISYLKIAWGNQEGVFDDYNTLKQFNQLNASEFEFDFGKNSLIPLKANKIWVVGYNANNEIVEKASTDLVKYKKENKLLYEFQVISDQQINTGTPSFYNRSKKTFLDIKENSPKSSVIVVNGDIVDEAKHANYASFYDSFNEAYATSAQKMTIGIGNHEFISHSESNSYIASLTKEQLQAKYEERLKLWKNETGNENQYFYEEINGNYFIYLGTTAYPQSLDGNTKASCVLGDDQLNWLKATLELANNSNKPIFLFSHGSLRNTVSGSLSDLNQTWYGYSLEEENKLRDIIKDYKQLLFFSSHSHWSFESEKPYVINDNYPSFFNTAAIGYLWEGEGGGQHYENGTYENGGAQGLYLEVYEDQIVIKGRQFEASDMTSKYWHSSYQAVWEY